MSACDCVHSRLRRAREKHAAEQAKQPAPKRQPRKPEKGAQADD